MNTILAETFLSLDQSLLRHFLAGFAIASLGALHRGFIILSVLATTAVEASDYLFATGDPGYDDLWAGYAGAGLVLVMLHRSTVNAPATRGGPYLLN